MRPHRQLVDEQVVPVVEHLHGQHAGDVELPGDPQCELLGGDRILIRRPATALDAHELILRGLPASALDHLVDKLVFIGKTDSLEKAVGMSVRTYQRRKDAPSKPLSQEQRDKLREADKAREAREAREAQKRKDRSPPSRQGSKREKSAPFVNGGDKFDPLNSAL